MIHPHVAYLADRQMTHHNILTRAARAASRDAPPPDTLAATAARIADRLREHFDPGTLPVQQALALAEEAGEFTAAYRRWAGLARRTGTWDDVCAELADVVITAYITAAVLGIDLDAAWRAKARVILTRGWREPPPAA